MMENLRSYILCMISAAVIIGVLSSFTSAGGVIKLVGGVILMISMIQPLARFDFEGIQRYFEYSFAEGEAAAEQGSAIAEKAMADIIKEETEAYILDKARLYGAEIRADVHVSSDSIPIPREVTVTGDYTAVSKQLLQEMIEEELGIPKEYQLWTGRN